MATVADILNEAKALNGPVPNPTFEELKQKLARLLYAAHESFNHAYLVTRPEGVIRDLYYATIQANTVAGWLRKARKMQESELRNLFISIFEPFVPVIEAVHALKPRVFKKGSAQDPNVVAKQEAYQAPKAASAAVQSVVKVLTTLTDSIKVQYEEQVYTYLLGSLEQAWELYQADSLRRGTLGNFLLNRYGVRNDNPCFCGRFTGLRDGYQESLRREAHEEAELMQQTFLARNVKKLASLVEVKGNLTGEPEILEAGVRKGRIIGRIQFNFDDHSSFQVMNSIVANRTKYDKVYYQFPVTFHIVVATNGKITAKMSEKQMNEMWAK